MSVETHVADAIERVETEQARVERKLAGFEEFIATVQATDPVGAAGVGMADPMTDGGVTTALEVGGGSSEPCDRVRESFGEAILPAMAGSPSLGEAMADELSEEVALVLSPNSPHSFTPTVQESVCATAEQRRGEVRVVGRTLSVEASSLRSAAAAVDEMTSWLTETDRTPLLEAGFEELRRRHERLATFRDRCDELARERQETLELTISDRGKAGVAHHSVVESLYEDFPTTHPVLSTVAKLEGCCADCQEAVRDHLTRRV